MKKTTKSEPIPRTVGKRFNFGLSLKDAKVVERAALLENKSVKEFVIHTVLSHALSYVEPTGR